MAQRGSPDSTPPRNSPPSRSFTSSSLLGHFNAITTSIQRRLSGGISPISSPASTPPSNNTQTHHPSHHSDPPLAPVSLHGYNAATTERILTEELAEEIRLMLPVRLQIQDTWDLVYSLDQHGVSLATLYSRSRAFNSPQAGFVVIIKDRREGVFGAYLSDYPHVHPHYYGNGECFLFKFTQLHYSSTINLPLSRQSATSPIVASSREKVKLHHHHRAVFAESIEGEKIIDHDRLDVPRPSSSASTETTSPHYQFKGFPYTGLNDYMILCTPQFLSVGGGYTTPLHRLMGTNRKGRQVWAIPG